jgi:hypothetical protein
MTDATGFFSAARNRVFVSAKSQVIISNLAPTPNSKPDGRFCRLTISSCLRDARRSRITDLDYKNVREVRESSSENDKGPSYDLEIKLRFISVFLSKGTTIHDIVNIW